MHKFYKRDDERFDCERCGGTFDNTNNEPCSSELGIINAVEIVNSINQPKIVKLSKYHKYQRTYKKNDLDIKTVKSNNRLSFELRCVKWKIKGWSVFGLN